MLNKVYVQVREISIDDLDVKLDRLIEVLKLYKAEVPEEFREQVNTSWEVWEEDGETYGSVTLYYYRPKTEAEMEEQRAQAAALENARQEREMRMAERDAMNTAEAGKLEAKLTVPLI